MLITITLVEGPSYAVHKPNSATTFREANKILSRWAMIAPKDGGYYKCDFSIKHLDPELQYEGRYDLKHHSVETVDLRGHVVGHLRFRSGEACPSHMTEAEYQNLLAEVYRFDEAAQKRAKTWADWMENRP